MNENDVMKIFVPKNYARKYGAISVQYGNTAIWTLAEVVTHVR